MRVLYLSKISVHRLKFRLLFVVLTGFFILLIDGKTVLSTHEVDHRFTVFGVVRNSSGVPQSNIKVMVSDTLTGEGNTVFTDEKGYYEVVLHFHNNNLGDEIRVISGPFKKSIRASFNPDDRVTERKSEVNLELGAGEALNLTKGWSIAAGILFLVSTLLIMKKLIQNRRPAIR